MSTLTGGCTVRLATSSCSLSGAVTVSGRDAYSIGFKAAEHPDTVRARRPASTYPHKFFTSATIVGDAIAQVTGQPFMYTQTPPWHPMHQSRGRDCGVL